METAQQRASAERQALILQATLEIITEQGLAQTKISTISKRAQASVGSIYHHFGSREGVFYALYHESFKLCFAELKAAVYAADNAQDGVCGLVKSYLQWVADNPQRAKFIYEASQGGVLHHFQTEVAAFKEAFYRDILAWMRPFIEAGEIIVLPPWAYDAILMGPAHEFARRWLAGQKEIPMPEAQEIIAAAVWRAFRPT